MYHDFGSGYTVTTVQESLDRRLAQITSVKLSDLVRYVEDVENHRGQLDALQAVESSFSAITRAATEHGWDATLVVAQKLNAVSRHALRRTDDTYSGRGNDARRAFYDGWRDALEAVQRELQLELTDLVRAINNAVEEVQ